MNPTFHEHNVVVPALPATTIASAGTQAGSRIINPGGRGRQLTFLLALATGGTPTALAINVQGSNDNGTTWTNLTDNLGNALAFPQAAAIAAAIAGGVLIGTIKPSRAAYKDFRLNVATVTGATVTASAIAVISSLYDQPPLATAGVPANGPQLDQLLNLFLPLGAT